MSSKKSNGAEQTSPMTLEQLRVWLTWLQTALPVIITLLQSFQLLSEGPEPLRRFKAEQAAQWEGIDDEEDEPAPKKRTPSVKPKVVQPVKVEASKPGTDSCGTNTRTGKAARGKGCGKQWDAENGANGYRCPECRASKGKASKTAKAAKVTTPSKPSKTDKRAAKAAKRARKAAKQAAEAAATTVGPEREPKTGNRGGGEHCTCRVCGDEFTGSVGDEHCEGQQGECYRLWRNARERVRVAASKGKAPAGAHKVDGLVLMALATHTSAPDKVRAHLLQTDS